MAAGLLRESAPDFSDPIGLLAACHGRITDNCELLQRMCDHQDGHGADHELIAASKRVLRYFDDAAPLHHADEEQDLFPALAGEADLQSLMARLQTEHAEHDAMWQSLREDLSRIAAGHASASLTTHAVPFVRATLEHVVLENQHILPRAREVLDAETLLDIGNAMAKRRRS